MLPTLCWSVIWGCNKPEATLGIFPLTSSALAAVTQHNLLQTLLCFMWLLTRSDPILTQWTHICILLIEKGPPISKELTRREIATKSSCDLSFCYTLTKFHEKNQWHHSIKLHSGSWWFDFAPSNEASDMQKEHLGKITESLWKLQGLTLQERFSLRPQALVTTLTPPIMGTSLQGAYLLVQQYLQSINILPKLPLCA